MASQRLVLAGIGFIGAILLCQPPSLAGEEAVASGIAEDFFQAGRRDFERADYVQAEREFRAALLFQPDHAGAVAYLTLIEKVQSKRAQAMEDAVRAAVPQRRGTQQARPPPPAEAQSRMLSPIMPSPLKRVGEIGLFVNGIEVGLERPIVLDQVGRPLLSLRDVAPALYVGVLETGTGTFQLLFPDGVMKTAHVTLIGREPMVTEQEVRELFAVETLYDAIKKSVQVQTGTSPEFHAYTVAKPPDQLRREEAIKALTREAAEAESNEIPEAARPSIDLRGTVSYGYLDPHAASPDHNLVTSVAGKAYGFDVRGESVRKDRGGVFRHDNSYLNFTKPDLFVGFFDQSTDLSPLRGQSERFNGAKVRKTWDQVNTTTLLGGTIQDSVSGPSGQAVYLGQLYEVREQFNPVPWFRLTDALLYLEREADLEALIGTTRAPRQNIISFNDASLQFPWGLSASGQVAYVDYAPDNAPKTNVTDWNWRSSLSLKKRRYNLDFVTEYVGDQYASVGNPAAYQDYAGWNLLGNYRLTDAWSFSGTLQRYHNNVANDAGKVTQENQALSLGSSFRLAKDQSLNLTFNDFLSNPHGPDPGTSNRTRLYRVDYALPFLLDSRLLLNYSLSTTRQPAASDSHSHSLGASLFKGFGRGSSVYLSEQIARSIFDSDPTTLVSTTSLNVNHQLTRDLNLYLDSAYSRSAIPSAHSEVESYSAGSGFRLQVSRDTLLTSEYRLSSSHADREKGGWPRNWSYFVSLQQSFGLATPPAFGSIDGWVVKDLNADGKMDPGEPGLEDVRVLLGSDREIVTTPEGHFSFARVVPGKQRVLVDLASLPLDWTLGTPVEMVEVGRNKHITVIFPVVAAASIEGRVFIDGNGDGIFQETEEPLEQIAVILSPGEQFRRTNSDGVFQFEQLLPGPYTVTIYTNDLPKGYELVSPEQVAVPLAAGQNVRDVAFAVRLRSAPK